MTAETSSARGAVDDGTVLVRLHRPAGYDDVHPQLVLEDAGIHPDFRAELATPPPPTDAEVWARELLAACAGSAHVAEIIRSNPFAGGLIHIEHALRAIVAALSQQPEARGVVDDLIHAASNAATIIRNCVNAREIGEGYAQHADDIDAAIAALTGERNG